MPETTSRAQSVRHGRPVQEGIPPTRAERNRVLRQVQEYLAGVRVVPPLSADELHLHADSVIRAAGIDAKYRKYVAVVVHNEIWRERLAGIPYRRRLLLLPQCLRDEGRCRAELDEFGLICKRCGACPIGDLQTEAEGLGYVVLVAEGTTIVTSLIQRGRIDGVVGVSCLSVLEKVFPHISLAAVPGVAIPLLQDGCASTSVDLESLWDAIYLTGEDKTRRLDLNALRRTVESWFAADSIAEALGWPQSQTERIAQGWLAKTGKRWRPFLAACAFQACRADPGAGELAGSSLPDGLRKVALAVECFHKASLVHDDIEDGDALRYGEKTLHEQHGIPVALNVGDFLLGEGYRMIGACPGPEGQTVEMIRVAAEGHRTLALGQGAELCWRRDPGPLSVRQVLAIFARKTAPAFEVALRLGAICAGADAQLWEVLKAYSQAVGIAYQIRDDIRDFCGQADPADVHAMRPSVLLAIAHERAAGPARQAVAGLWRSAGTSEPAGREIAEIFADLQVEPAAAALLESYKQQAIRSLRPLANADLKGLLRRVVGKIFDDIETIGGCRERKAGNAADHAVGTEPVA